MDTNTATVSRIAHLSDLHILEPRPSRSRPAYPVSVRYLSLGRPLDAPARRKKLARALAVAKRSGADHFVLSGDLTEVGAPREYESLAEALSEARLPASAVTLVPGNHDLYHSPDAWTKALEGPLAPWAESSAGAPGKVVERDNIVFMPVDVACHQHFTRSGGQLLDVTAEAVERRIQDNAFRHRPVVLVHHHPPFMRPVGLNWIDGLKGGARIMMLLARFRHVFSLHGHMHSIVDKVVEMGRCRIFGAPAVVEDEEVARVRIYQVRDGLLESAGLVSA
jgi:3',5'-cyclic AMP phosphodiesterase CpdA